jgi:hypothetical protein
MSKSYTSSPLAACMAVAGQLYFYQSYIRFLPSSIGIRSVNSTVLSFTSHYQPFRVLLGKRIVAQMVKNSRRLTKLKFSLPCYADVVPGLCTEPDKSIHNLM